MEVSLAIDLSLLIRKVAVDYLNFNDGTVRKREIKEITYSGCAPEGNSAEH